jgi:exodeoxyribonuclease-3
LGYKYTYWYPAKKKGYSGVGIISKVKPNHIEFGCGIDYMDEEGRILRADFDDFSLISLYLPSGTNDARLQLKFDFMDDFYEYINKLKIEIPNLVICGDYNICHEPIDIHDPVRLKTVSGFLPEEREWLSKFLDNGFTDSFRLKNPEVEQYSWWSYRANARANNKGWRLDYHLVSEPIKQNIERAVILPEAKHSDHCPVLLKLTF